MCRCPILTIRASSFFPARIESAYTDARISSDTSTAIVKGNRIQLVPFSQFSWWNKYQFTPVWSAALGTIYFSNSYASSDDNVRLPRFVRFDGAIYAQITPTWKVELNVENILNRPYWASTDRNNNILARPDAHRSLDHLRQILRRTTQCGATGGCLDVESQG